MNVYEKIESFANLKEGWGYGNGGAISENIRNQSKELVKHLSEIYCDTMIDAIPSENDEIQIAFLYEIYDVEISICYDNKYDLLIWTDRQEFIVDLESVSYEKIIETVKLTLDI